MSELPGTVLWVRVMVLGPVEVVGDDGVVTPVTPPREQVVMVAMALAAPDGVSAGRLIDVVWGDEPPSSAAATLKALVHRLRRRHGSSLVATVTGGYRLGGRVADTDLEVAAVMAKSGRAALASGEVLTAVDHLDQALACFRGDPTPALGGSTAGATLVQHLDQLRSGVVEDLLDAKLAAGGAVELLAELESAVADEPLHERRWERLMIALYRSGQQAGALGAFQRARKALVDGAGVEPGPALRELEHRIFEQDERLFGGDLGVGPSGDGGVAEPEPARVTPTRSDAGWIGYDTPMVGREDHLQAACSILDDHARSRLVLLSGDAGMGKTRLSAEIAKSALEGGATILYGQCEAGSPAPFRPFSTAVGRFVDANPVDVVEPLLGPSPGLLSRIVPTLRDSFEISAEPSIDPDGDQLRAFDSFAELLRRLAVGGGLVLVLDDLHWATAATVTLLRHLVAQSDADDVTIIGTYRPRDMASSHPFVAALSDLHRTGRTTTIHLDRLEVDDVRRFVEHTADQAVPTEVAQRFTATTGGVPYLLVSTLTYLTNTEGVVRRGGRWELSAGALATLPAGVKHLIGERLAQLPEPATALMRSAAVVGFDFALSVATAAAGLGAETALDAIETAELAGLVHESGFDRWRWDHDLARSIVLGELSTTRRVQLHWRIAQLLADQPHPPHDDIAHHATEGLLAARRVEAARLLRNAAEDALDRAPAAALAYAGTGLEALDGHDHPLLAARLFTVRAITTFETCENPDSEHVIAAMIDAEQASLATDDLDLIVRAHTIEGRYPGPRQFFQFDQRRVAAGLAALDRLPTDAYDQRVVLLGHLAELHYCELEAPFRRRVFKELLDLFERSDLDVKARTRAANSLGTFQVVTLDGEVLELTDQMKNRAPGRRNTPSEFDSWDALEGDEDKRVPMRHLEVKLANGDFGALANDLTTMSSTWEEASPTDRLTILRVRCILGTITGDLEPLRFAVRWIDENPPTPRMYRLIMELRREALAGLTVFTGENQDAAAAYLHELRDPNLASAPRVLYQAAAVWISMLEGDDATAHRLYSDLPHGWTTGTPGQWWPDIMGAVVTTATCQFGSAGDRLRLVRLLAPLSGKWSLLPMVSAGPVDLALARLAMASDEDPTDWLVKAMAASRSAGASFWEAQVLELMATAGIAVDG